MIFSSKFSKIVISFLVLMLVNSSIGSIEYYIDGDKIETSYVTTDDAIARSYGDGDGYYKVATGGSNYVSVNGAEPTELVKIVKDGDIDDVRLDVPETFKKSGYNEITYEARLENNKINLYVSDSRGRNEVYTDLDEDEDDKNLIVFPSSSDSPIFAMRYSGMEEMFGELFLSFDEIFLFDSSSTIPDGLYVPDGSYTLTSTPYEYSGLGTYMGFNETHEIDDESLTFECLVGYNDVPGTDITTDDSLLLDSAAVPILIDEDEDFFIVVSRSYDEFYLDYELKAISVDADGNTSTIDFLKNGDVLESNVRIPKNGIYVYRAEEIKNSPESSSSIAEDFPTVIIKFGTFITGQESNAIEIEAIFQVSEYAYENVNLQTPVVVADSWTVDITAQNTIQNATIGVDSSATDDNDEFDSWTLPPYPFNKVFLLLDGCFAKSIKQSNNGSSWDFQVRVPDGQTTELNWDPDAIDGVTIKIMEGSSEITPEQPISSGLHHMVIYAIYGDSFDPRPVININRPSYLLRNYNLTGTVTDNDLGTLSYKVNGQSNSLPYSQDGDIYSFDETLDLADGEYTVEVEAADSASVSKTVNFKVDNTEPDVNVSIDTYADNALISVSATDENYLYLIDCRVKNSDYQDYDTWTVQNSKSFDRTFKHYDLDAGTYNAYIHVEDYVGNIASFITEFEIEDIYPPEIYIHSPENEANYSAFPDIDVTTDEEATLIYGLNGYNDTLTMLDQHAVDGKNTLVIYATDLAGNTASKEITFYHDTVLSASFSANVTSGKIPLSVQFIDTSTNSAQSWLWNFGDGSTSSEQNPTHTYTSAGTYNVTLNVTNADGSNTSTQLSYITAAVTPVSNFSANVTSGDIPLSVNFTDLSQNSPTSWLWDFGDGSTSTDQNPTHTYASSGIYNVSLNATNVGGSNVCTQFSYITATLTPVSIPYDYSAYGDYIGFYDSGDPYLISYNNNEPSGVSDEDSLFSKSWAVKVLVDEEDTDSVYLGNSIILEDGYAIDIVTITNNGDNVLLNLLQNGTSVDSAIILEENDIYVYRTRVNCGNDYIDDFPIIIFKIDTIFRGTESNAVFFNGLFQLDENAYEIVLDDICPPEITINSPEQGANYTSFPSINVTTNEEATFVYSLNGQNASTTSELETYIVEGENTLVVYATDLAGNTASKEVTFYYVIEEEGGELVNGGFETGDTTGWTVTTDESGTCHYHTYNVSEEYNYSGLYGCELYTDTCFISSSSVSLTQNVNLTNVDYITFNHQCTYESSALEPNSYVYSQLEFYVDEDITTIPLFNNLSIINVWKNQEIDVSSYTGCHNITIRLYSVAPYQPVAATARVNIDDVTLVFEIPDTYPPEITINSPEQGANYTSFPSINVTTNEEATFVYSLNGQNASTTSELETYIVEGENTLVVYATDLAGNTASEEVTFYYAIEEEGGELVNGGFETGNISGWTVTTDESGPGSKIHTYNISEEHSYSGIYGCELHTMACIFSNSSISLTQNVNLTDVDYITFNHQCTFEHSALEPSSYVYSQLEFYVDENMTAIPLFNNSSIINVWKNEEIDVSNYTGHHNITIGLHSVAPYIQVLAEARVEIDDIILVDAQEDWNPWNDMDSDNGLYITTHELFAAYSYWRSGNPISETGAVVTTTRLNALSYYWSYGEMPEGTESGPSVSAHRYISSYNVTSGGTFNVSINMSVNMNEDQCLNMVTLEEDLPVNWGVTPIFNDGWAYDSSTGEWEHATISSNTNFEIEYGVTVPGNITGGIYNVSGLVSSNGLVDVEVSGDSNVYVMDDWNPWNDWDSEGSPDGRYITSGEVIAAYNCVRYSTPAPRTGAQVETEQVTEMYDAWRFNNPM